MRIVVHARESVPGAVYFCDGLQALGHEGHIRSMSDHHLGDVEPDFDVCVTFGLSGKGLNILKSYQAIGVPVVVVDYGYMRRTNYVHDWKTGHWQVSLGGLNAVPPMPCPSDRFDALGLKVKEHGGDPKGYVLLCAQTPSDQAHQMGVPEMIDWIKAKAKKYPDLVVRQHPLAPFDHGQPECKAETIEEALAGARLMVTLNSNSGNEALMAGVPCTYERSPASWAELAGEKLPSKAVREAYFHRLAYGQWTWDEFKTSVPQKFIIDHILTGAPLVNEPQPAKRRGRPPKSKD